MLIIMIRSVIVYIIIILAIRLMGKKQLGELSPSELVTTIMVSNIATLSLEDSSIPLILGILPILMIVCLDVFNAYIILKSGKLRRLLGGKPKIIISDGILDQRELKNLRYTLDDVLEAMREQGIFDLNMVQYAIVETTGKINFYKRSEGVQNPPAAIVMDGEIIHDGLAQSGLDKSWLDKTLNKSGAGLGRVFLLTADKNGTFTLILKDN